MKTRSQSCRACARRITTWSGGGSFAVAALLGGPVIIGIVLFALPFFNGIGEKSWRRRPVVVILTYVALGLLTYLGITSPWSPDMNAWRADPTPKEFLTGRSPLQLQGLIVVQFMQCRNCHAIDGIGGHRGPDLADVGARLTKDQLVRQVIQGGGNMPAYGKNLSTAQVEAVVAYMVSLRPPGIPPARRWSRRGRELDSRNSAANRLHF